MNKTIAIYAGLVALGVGAVAAILYFGRSALSTKGTPYANAGAVGTVANVFDKASGGTLSATGSAIGESVYDWLNPTRNIPNATYTVLFPDGGKHAVNAEDIDANGYFQGSSDVYPWNVDPFGMGAYRWRIGTNSAGLRVAVPA